MDRISKETLAAFVDGELTDKEMERVAAHLETCAEDRAHVEELILSNALLARAFDAPMEEPAPDRLRAAIMGEAAPGAGDAGATVIPFARRARRWAAPAGLALAASVAAVLFLGGRDAAPTLSIAEGLLVVDGPLHAALETRPSGAAETAADGARFIPSATFADAAGRHCREVEAVAPGAARARVVEALIACREDGGVWRVAAAVAEHPAHKQGEGFVPASGGAASGIGAALDALGAGMALDPDAEAALIARGWN